jgi:serine/threonine protein phosphatase PrpC
MSGRAEPRHVAFEGGDLRVEDCMLSAHGASHPGRVRKHNEDAWRSEPDLGLFVVADGMGGHNAGEIASGLAVEAIHAFLRRTRDGDDVTWPYGIDATMSFNANRVLTAVRLANRRVFKAGESRDEYSGMGTTAVIALIEQGQLVFCGVGDSRLYLLRDGVLTQLTTDDSWVAAMAAEGVVSGPAAATHPMRHVLTNVVGARDSIDARVGERPLADGDLLMLCSDGLHGEVDPERMTAILKAEPDPAAAVDRLIAAALEGKAADNITALAVRYRT